MFNNQNRQSIRLKGYDYSQPGCYFITICAIIRGFKSATTKKINVTTGTPRVPLWQRNYWEHIICNECELDRIRYYIQNNPQCWHDDQLNCRDDNFIKDENASNGDED